MVYGHQNKSKACNYQVVKDKQKEPNTCSQAINPPSTRTLMSSSDPLLGIGEVVPGDDPSLIFVSTLADIAKKGDRGLSAC